MAWAISMLPMAESVGSRFEFLEDESYALLAQLRTLSVVERGKIDAIDDHAPGVAW